jgi:hypothetical protein
LRKFGLVLAAVFTLILGLVPPLLFGKDWKLLPFGMTASLAIWAIMAPAGLQFFYTWWMKLALALNAVTSRIILGLVFYLLITPTGFLKRKISGDSMRRTFDPDLKSYRVEPKNARYKNMETPF